MVKKFNESRIPEDFSKTCSQQCLMIGPSNVHRVVTVLFHGTSKCLAAMKSMEQAKSIVFRSVDNSFLCGAKVEFIPNADDPTNPASGRWDYTWSCYEDDLENSEVIEFNTNSLMASYYESSAAQLYNMKFPGTCVYLMDLSCEMIINWCKENATDAEEATLELDGVFKATGAVENGKVVVGIVPAGEMKVLIKDDSAIQE